MGGRYFSLTIYIFFGGSFGLFCGFVKSIVVFQLGLVRCMYVRMDGKSEKCSECERPLR